MSEIMMDRRKSLESRSKIITEEDLKRDASKADLFKTFSEKFGGSPKLADLLLKDEQTRTDPEKTRLEKGFDEFNDRIEAAEDLIEYIKTQKMYDDIAESTPVPKEGFEQFIKGMALRNKGSLTLLRADIILAQAKGQNGALKERYGKAKAELMQIGSRFGFDEEQMLGIALQKNATDRNAAIAALLQNSDITSGKGLLGKIESVARVSWGLSNDAGVVIRDSVERFARIRAAYDDSMKNLENRFDTASKEDRAFTEDVKRSIEAAQNSDPSPSLEEARTSLNDPSTVHEMMRTIIKEKYGDAELDKFDRTATDGTISESDFETRGFGAQGTGTFESNAQIYEQAVDRLHDAYGRRGTLGSFLKMFLTLFQSDAKSAAQRSNLWKAIRAKK